MSAETSVHSMIIAFDGESKCGKTTFTEMVADEARFQASFYRGDEIGDDWDPVMRQTVQDTARPWADSINFRNISTISAGNAFRAAAYYVLRQESNDHELSSFSRTDVDKIRNILAEDGVIEHLQTDTTIGKRVSSIAKMTGAQALCGTIFCDSVLEAYGYEGGSNLVVIDARDPVGHMTRLNMFGSETNKILPASVVPIYIDTPVEVAASRMSGDMSSNVELVTDRRKSDSSRAELPVVKPEGMVMDYTVWFDALLKQRSHSDIISHFVAKNDATITFDNIQRLAGTVAAAAHIIGLQLGASQVYEAAPLY